MKAKRQYLSRVRGTKMAGKNTICLWYNGTALDAAKFYPGRKPNCGRAQRGMLIRRTRWPVR